MEYSNVPGGAPAPNDVEVRSFDGDLVKRVTLDQAAKMVEADIGEWRRGYVRLFLGIRVRTVVLNGRPDLEKMRQEQPKRYSAFWRSGGRGHQLRLPGKSTGDRTVHFPLLSHPTNSLNANHEREMAKERLS